MSVSTGASRVDTQAGALQQTENPLDVALEGDGYFGVETPGGTRYTRAGNFHLDDARKLVTSEGMQVRGEGGAAITIPAEAKSIAVATDGTVSADGEELGKLELVRFASSQLKREGGTLFTAKGKPEAGDPPVVRSGMLESSNVNVVRGVVDLVKVSRSYESLMRIIQGYHDVESRAARELGGPK
jgi:flagellar basal-body rod protein FlgF